MSSDNREDSFLRLLDRDVLRQVQLSGDVATRKLLVAVSGGPDSVCMLHLLHRVAAEYRLRLHVVHVNHGLRAAATSDADFVTQLAAQLGCELSVVQVTPRSSSESDMRLARYEAFRKVADEVGTTALALGHTKDDLVETVLMNVIRGAGLNAFQFSGYQWSGNLQLVRPLWQTSREEVLAVSKTLNWDSCLDETNDSLRFTRNRIRHVLLPLIEKEFNPRIRESLTRMAQVFGSASDYVESVAMQKLQRCLRLQKQVRVLPMRWLAQQPDAILMAIIRQWVEGHEFTGFLSHEHVERCVSAMRSGHGVAVPLAHGHALVCTHRFTWLYNAEINGPLGAPGEDDNARLASDHCSKFGTPVITWGYSALPDGKSARETSYELSDSSECSTWDMAGRRLYLRVKDSQQNAYTVRAREPGDCLPDGRSIKEIMINDKVPWYLRKFMACVINGTGHVVHVFGYDRLNGRIRQLPGYSSAHFGWSTVEPPFKNV